MQAVGWAQHKRISREGCRAVGEAAHPPPPQPAHAPHAAPAHLDHQPALQHSLASHLPRPLRLAQPRLQTYTAPQSAGQYRFIMGGGVFVGTGDYLDEEVPAGADKARMTRAQVSMDCIVCMFVCV